MAANKGAPQDDHQSTDDAKDWRGWYALVLGTLLVVILVFTLLGRHFQ
jgi:hypothetical protein